MRVRDGSLESLELLGLQPLDSDIEGFLSSKPRLVAEITCCFLVDEGAIHAGRIDREPIEVGRAGKSLNQPRESIRQTIGYGYLRPTYA